MQLLDLLERLERPVLLHKGVHVVELLRFDVVQQGPQLLRVVLHGGPREQKDTFAGVILEELEGLGLLVLETVGLINNDVDEGDLLEDGVQV